MAHGSAGLVFKKWSFGKVRNLIVEFEIEVEVLLGGMRTVDLALEVDDSSANLQEDIRV